MAFIAGSNHFISGVTPTLYGLNSGSDLIRDLDTDVITLNANVTGEGVGDTVLTPGAPIWTSNSSCSNVQIATDHNGWIAIVEAQSVANTANLHIVDTDGTSRANFRLPSSTTSSYGTKASLAMAHGRVVVGDPFGNGQNGRVFVYDYDGNLLHTISPDGTQQGTYGSTQFGATVSIGAGRIIIGNPLFYSGSFLTGMFAIYDYQANLIDNFFKSQPYTASGFLTNNTFGNVNHAHAIGHGKFLFSRAEAGNSNSSTQGERVVTIDLKGGPGVVGQYSLRDFFYEEKLHDEYYNFLTGSLNTVNSTTYGIRYGDVGCGVAVLSNQVGELFVIDMESGASLGVIEPVEGLSTINPISTEMPVKVGYGRIIVGTPGESVTVTDGGTTIYTNAGAVTIHDIISSGAQFEAGFESPVGPDRKGMRAYYKFVHPDADNAINIQDKKFGQAVAIGNGYAVMSSGTGPMEVYCEEISTAITPYDIIDQQSYGY